MNRPTLDRAVQWLVKLLADGPQTAEYCIGTARAHGIGRVTLYRAKKILGICSGQQQNYFGTFQPVLWGLPAPLPPNPCYSPSAPQRTPRHEPALPGTFACIIGVYHGSGMIRAQ